MNYELRDRTKKFALNCIELAEKLPNTVLGRHIKGQLIRSSTSVAANYRAANLGQSKAAFTSKLSIVIEEADESEFWLEIIEDKQIIRDNEVTRLKNEAHEIASILITSRKTIMQRDK
jgi:four helix bundle protein